MCSSDLQTVPPRNFISPPRLRPQPPRQLRPQVPKAVDRLCQDMLEPLFDNRISSATEVAERLEWVLHLDRFRPAKILAMALICVVSVLAALVLENRGLVRYWWAGAIPKARDVGLSDEHAVVLFPNSEKDAVLIPGTLSLFDLGTGALEQARLNVRSHYLNQFVFFMNLRESKPLADDVLAECDAIHFVRVRDTPTIGLEQGPCDPGWIRFIVTYRRYVVRKNQTSFAPADDDIYATGSICVRLADIEDGHDFEVVCNKGKVTTITMCGKPAIKVPEEKSPIINGDFGIALQKECVQIGRAHV